MSNNDDLHPIRDDILTRKQVIADLNVNYGNHICSKYDSDCCRNKIYILTKNCLQEVLQVCFLADIRVFKNDNDHV